MLMITRGRDSTSLTERPSAACCCAGDEAAAAAQQAALEAAALALHQEQQPKYWTDYLQVIFATLALHYCGSTCVAHDLALMFWQPQCSSWRQVVAATNCSLLCLCERSSVLIMSKNYSSGV